VSIAALEFEQRLNSKVVPFVGTGHDRQRRNPMQENDHKPVITIATVAEVIGGIFCFAGVFIGHALIDTGHLQGVTGVAMGLSSTLPTLVGGLLLFFAGRILRAVVDNSNASAGLLSKEH